MSTLRRGAAVAVATLAAMASVGLAGGPAAGAPSEVAALPVVNHERLLLAAQLDPSKPDRGLTSGAEASVKTVKAALRAKGLLAASDTDGHFGRGTMDAWRAWENRVHTTANPWSTNGLPSLYELNELAPNRFTLSNKVDQGSWVTEDGEAVNERTRAMFRKAEALSSNMTITQGRGGADASAGTHVGGGVIDIRVNDAPSQTSARVAALRKVGFAAWFRNWSGNEHIHAIAMGDPWVAYGSHRSLCQIYQFRFGGEGGSCSDSTAGADRPLVWWEQYQRTL
ncbi:hypothetical protein [Knoellia sp. LjRoot47]|uniref:hypothetical protein n=1 Tax=Knoellia sp. LjRoot47 TaxID=3342330 RepID=UPI003ECFD19B